VDKTLGSIMKQGRSLGVNIIIATQHPTAKQIGEIIAQSFTHRFVGRVYNANSALWATGIERSGAEKLLTRGSFLYCEGSATRIQVFSNG
jgi:DNA segregation ATPase FtsK/SpoIIIE-like protein